MPGKTQWQPSELSTQITALTTINSKILAGETPNNKIYQSSDGMEWDSISTLETSYIDVLETIDNYVFALLSRGWFDTSYPVTSIYRSPDEGLTWDSIHASDYGSRVIFKHKGFLFSNVHYGGIIRSPDMGETWTGLSFPLSLYNAIGSNENRLFAHPYDNNLYFSDDAGDNWEIVVNFPANVEVHYISSTNDNIYVSADSNYTDRIYFSDDDGESWQLIMDGLENVNYISGFFVCEDMLFCTTLFNQIYAANNEQPIWENITDNLSLTGGANIFSIEKFGENLFIGTNNGIWYRPYDEIVGFDKVYPKTHVVLEQNFPNPFRLQTTIPVSLKKPTHITLTIHDLKGQMLKVMADGNFPKGIHYFNLKDEDLDQGIYIYMLSTPDGTIIKKLVLL